MLISVVHLADGNVGAVSFMTVLLVELLVEKSRSSEFLGEAAGLRGEDLRLCRLWLRRHSCENSLWFSLQSIPTFQEKSLTLVFSFIFSLNEKKRRKKRKTNTGEKKEDRGRGTRAEVIRIPVHVSGPIPGSWYSQLFLTSLHTYPTLPSRR